jgi:carbon monoxide dehydrogenase subunit G
MSTLKIEERINVSAPPARVWKFLLDPARVAGCLPGAKLDGVDGDRTFLGTMKVKVGPVLMEFKGKATLSEVDEAERRVTMTGTGNDKSGGGSAKMDMKSHIVAADGGGSEIVVVADVDLAGKLVRFGRGMMEGISKQLFKQFSERVRAELANEAEEPAPAVEAKVEEAPIEAKEEAPQEEPKSEAPIPTPEVEAQEPEPAKEEPAKEEPKPPEAPVEEKAPAKAESPPAIEAEPEPAPKKAAPLAKPKDDEALDAGSLVWAALWAWIKGLFRRLLGKRG